MTSNFLKLVGEQIRFLRKQKGLTQEALSEKAGIHYSYISGIENADRNISLETLEKIINALEVNPVQIFSFHQMEFKVDHTDKKVAIDALNSLIADRSSNEVLSVLRVSKELLAAYDEPSSRKDD
ncbi:helix-turn-helix domain-containing protein [Paenibacillus xylanexedens]|uniref:helix-turn-helix domain-containing protein n=1 Tax=Paenibacillus xylanexedens TaxID=528191 RepID=UPI003D019368